MWERVALLNYWFEAGEPDRSNGRLHFYGSDPGGELSGWRKVKLQRGLVRHPSSQVRVAACRELVHTGWGQDECWEQLTEEERRHIRDGGWRCCTAAQVAAMRRQMAEVDARVHWRARDRDERRILTAVSDRRMRVEFCRMYEAAYPGDKDTGCPAWLAPPATRVTEAGDVPLRGAWPR